MVRQLQIREAAAPVPDRRGAGLDNYAGLFDAYYYAHSCGRTYQRDEVWLNFFDQIAQRIIVDLQPASVLDAGCALGFLVEALRKRGVEAYGIDISEYAIQHVHESIREYCRAGSVSDPLPRRYDLIVSIEVLEHMPQVDAEHAVENFCQYTDRVLFSSSPTDYKEATHFNVHPPEYWATLFARCGFFRDMELDAAFITPWAVCFRKTEEPVWRLVAGYERQLWHRLQDSNAQREVNLEQRALVARQNDEIAEQRALVARQAEQSALVARLNEEIAEQRALVARQNDEIAEQRDLVTRRNVEIVEQLKLAARLDGEIRMRDHAIAVLEQRRTQLESTAGWALLSRLQKIRAAVAPPASTRDQALENLWQALRTRSQARLATAMHLIGADIRRRAGGPHP